MALRDFARRFQRCTFRQRTARRHLPISPFPSIHQTPLDFRLMIVAAVYAADSFTLPPRRRRRDFR